MNRTALERAALELADGEACYYDHHGYCQSHFLHERPCPMELINAAVKETSTGTPDRMAPQGPATGDVGGDVVGDLVSEIIKENEELTEPAQDSKSPAARRAGSSPALGTSL